MAGRSVVVARTFGVGEVVGSNPTGPTQGIFFMSLIVQTKGFADFINITELVEKEILKSHVLEGVVVLFIKSTTAGLLLLEDEEGHLSDLKKTFEKIAPADSVYKHNEKWQDENGDAHIKSVFLKQNLIIPLKEGRLDLGNWQNIFLIDFDNKPREREIILKIIPL